MRGRMWDCRTHRRGIATVSNPPIEPKDSSLGTDPEIAVAGLGNRVNRSTWESLFRPPSLVDILRHRPIWIDRICWAGKRREPRHKTEHRKSRKKCPALLFPPIKGDIRISQ